MTQWVDPGTRGREKGPIGLVQSWIAVMVAPRRFFSRAVAPGDQAPGLVFLLVVVAIEEGSRYLLVPAARPVVDSQPMATTVVVLLVTVLLVAPLGLHLLAALQTILLWPITADRAGISETVQVLAYATAPCVFAGVPIPAVTIAAAGYGAIVLGIGLATVHDVEYHQALVAGAIPIALVYGVVFGGFDAISLLV
ncbi:YIP1 family protein [Halorhabdus salina]|uniref:YIP1 family protein n=1 Tax=Halorhabdus salina TaxID=2750670 RepID=UPI0015EE5E95|nr:YIP1 family protein [Halorhabdus salina]